VPDRPDVTEVVDELNRLMAEEAEACLRYFQMRFRLRGGIAHGLKPSSTKP
jgi:hypothetical protein